MFQQRQESGISTIGLLFVLAAGGFILLCFFRIGPSYQDDQFVRAALKSLRDGGLDLKQASKVEVRQQLGKFLTINGIRNVNIADFTIERRKERTLVSIIYESRVHLFINIDVVMTFKHQLDSSNPDECCSYVIEHEQKKEN